MFALMNPDNTVNRLTDGTQSVQWNDMNLPPPRMMIQAERVSNRIFDFVQASSIPEFNDAGGTTYAVDPAGTVHEVVAVVPWNATKLGEHRATEITKAIDAMLEAKAVALRYDSILSARSYAGYVNPFQAEALRLANWAAGCWAMAGTIEAEVLAGTPLPTVAQAMARMPVY